MNRYELTKTTELLQQMNVEIPDLPPYDPAKDEPFPWKSDIRATIEKLKTEKEAREKPKAEPGVASQLRPWIPGAGRFLCAGTALRLVRAT